MKIRHILAHAATSVAVLALITLSAAAQNYPAPKEGTRAETTTIAATNTNRSRRIIASSNAVEEAIPETPRSHRAREPQALQSKL
jgi:hypothetical protein